MWTTSTMYTILRNYILQRFERLYYLRQINLYEKLEAYSDVLKKVLDKPLVFEINDFYGAIRTIS